MSNPTALPRHPAALPDVPTPPTTQQITPATPRAEWIVIPRPPRVGHTRWQLSS